jgi:endonuclease/exonuclease/phosphatase family metal-dependent hydrolase
MMRPPLAAGLAALVVSLVAVPSALAVDRPVAGAIASMKSGVPTIKRSLGVILKDVSIAAPFVDPTTSAVLIISTSAAEGQCHVEVSLDPTLWRAIDGDGANQGYQYKSKPKQSQGIRKVKVLPGKIVIRGEGKRWPCTLEADQLTLPLRIELRLGGESGDRYCAAFGGVVKTNKPKRFKAKAAPAPEACMPLDVSVASLNILHGAVGADCLSTEQCRLEDRIDLLFEWIVDSDCPDIVTLQEVIDGGTNISALAPIEAAAATACPFAYQVVFLPVIGFDEELVLSRYPVLATDVMLLTGAFRNVLFARIDHPVGPVDVFSTHLASGADNGDADCDRNCPQQCQDEGLTIRQCQARQMSGFIVEHHDVGAPAFAAGDFNAEPGSATYAEFVDRGWIDVYLAAGNPECQAEGDAGCTSGREDNDLSDLESPDDNVDRRIDFIFLIPPAEGSVCAAMLDDGLDSDLDGTPTATFAGTANPFAPSCGPAPDPPCWPSDHEGVIVDLNCG